MSSLISKLSHPPPSSEDPLTLIPPHTSIEAEAPPSLGAISLLALAICSFNNNKVY